MDTFMDQLSQKLNAQEIIRANGEAEAEAMAVMRVQVQEYRECLDRMQKVAEDLGGLQGRIAQLSDLQAAPAEGDSALTEELREIREQIGALAGQQSTLSDESLNELKEQIASLSGQQSSVSDEALEELRRAVADLAGKQSSVSDATVEGLRRQIEALRNDQSGAREEAIGSLKDQMEQMTRQSSEQLSKLSADLLGNIGSGDDFHRECVRIYRNVQAALIEENAKQTEEISAQIRRMNSGIKTVKILAILALVASILSAAAPFVVRFLL